MRHFFVDVTHRHVMLFYRRVAAVFFLHFSRVIAGSRHASSVFKRFIKKYFSVINFQLIKLIQSRYALQIQIVFGSTALLLFVTVPIFCYYLLLFVIICYYLGLEHGLEGDWCPLPPRGHQQEHLHHSHTFSPIFTVLFCV